MHLLTWLKTSSYMSIIVHFFSCTFRSFFLINSTNYDLTNELEGQFFNLWNNYFFNPAK